MRDTHQHQPCQHGGKQGPQGDDEKQESRGIVVLIDQKIGTLATDSGRHRQADAEHGNKHAQGIIKT
ncbi:hypothetical protein D3C80_678830 [compost metagenome]